MFVIVLQRPEGEKPFGLFIHRDLNDICFQFRDAARFRSKAKAQGAALLAVARHPEWIGALVVQEYVGQIRLPSGV